ncbi:hypothetical protein GC194_14805 [bacterium]|nr:hypothetical protein [bacterium]
MLRLLQTYLIQLKTKSAILSKPKLLRIKPLHKGRSQKLVSKFSLVLGLLFLAQVAAASHIMGGNIVFKNLDKNRYLVGVKVFVDCYRGNQSALYEDELHMGMYSKSTNSLVRDIPLTLKEGKGDTLKITKKSCAKKVNFCMFIAYYYDELEFDPAIYNDPKGYYLSWERCCRNQVIINIQDPQETGIVYYAEIPPFTIKNSLPEFTKIPLNLLCINSYFKYNFKVVDADGDSLVSSLVSPLKGHTSFSDDNSKTSASYPMLKPAPYSEVLWTGGYGPGRIMDGKPGLSLDSAGTIATVRPTRQGDFVFAVKIEEYRNGQKIGEVVRELQYKVGVCAANHSPNDTTLNTADTIKIFPGTKYNLRLNFKDHEGDSVFVKAEGSIFNRDLVGAPIAQFQAMSDKGKASATLSWSPQCHQINEEPYVVTLEASDNGCPFPATNLIKLKIKVLDPPVFDKPNDFCVSRIDNDKLLLSWNNSSFGSNYGGLVIEEKTEGGDWQVLDTVVQKQKNSYELASPQNNTQNICYRIKIVNYCGIASEVSHEYCSVADVGKPPLASKLLNVSVNDKEQAELIWTQNHDFDFNAYHIYRAVNEGLFDYYAKAKTVSDTTFTDSLIKADSNVYAYYIQTIDDCTELSEASTTGASILLSGSVTAYINQLHWTPVTVYDPAGYELIGSNLSESLLLNALFSHTEFDYPHELAIGDEGQWKYRIKAYNSDSTVLSWSNSIEMTQKPVVYIPNAFSPNRDAINKTWDINADFVKEYWLQVFNRWGELVFESHDATENWDAEKALDGTYLYKLSFRSLTGKIFFKTGSLVILR